MRNELEARTPALNVPIAISEEEPPTSTQRCRRPAGGRAPSGADEGEPRLLLVAEDLDRDAAAPRRRLARIVLVGGLPDRGGRDDADRGGSQLPRELHLGRHDLDDLGIFFCGIESPGSRPLAIRVNARWRNSSRRRPSAGSATSSRVVLEPMSIQPQITILKL